MPKWWNAPPRILHPARIAARDLATANKSASTKATCKVTSGRTAQPLIPSTARRTRAAAGRSSRSGRRCDRWLAEGATDIPGDHPTSRWRGARAQPWRIADRTWATQGIACSHKPMPLAARSAPVGSPSGKADTRQPPRFPARRPRLPMSVGAMYTMLRSLSLTPLQRVRVDPLAHDVPYCERRHLQSASLLLSRTMILCAMFAKSPPAPAILQNLESTPSGP